MRASIAKTIFIAMVMAFAVIGLSRTAKAQSVGKPPSPTSLSTVSSTNTLAASSLDTNIVDDLDAIPTNSMDSLDDKYKLAVGDHINFRILEDQDDPHPLIVMDSGDIEVPYIGRYPAVGKTCKQLAFQIKTNLQKSYYYRATVVISVSSMATKGIIYLDGAVRSPGPLEIPRDEVLTISKAILRAGGFTDFADQSRVRVTRNGANGTNDVFIVDVSKVLNPVKGKASEDQPVEAGDLIYVPEKVFRF